MFSSKLKVIFSVSALISPPHKRTFVATCQQVGSSTDPSIAILLSLLGILVAGPTQVGINCSPLGNGCCRLDLASNGGQAMTCQSLFGGASPCGDEGDSLHATYFQPGKIDRRQLSRRDIVFLSRAAAGSGKALVEASFVHLRRL
ncbi:hypothetical protein C8R45DRAFT_939571 [Mycena sanguinolenta]|nr:hypothetical protein C8R45DRAFT_939571 [Mycena sanguinolenta]